MTADTYSAEQDEQGRWYVVAHYGQVRIACGPACASRTEAEPRAERMTAEVTGDYLAGRD